MELFSEIYSCYYQVMRHLLCSQNPVTIQNIRQQIHGEGFEESLLAIIPKLENGAWNLFEKEGTLFLSKLNSSFVMPLSTLEKSYLKALLSDPRIGLFLDDPQRDTLNDMLDSAAPLFSPEQFYYYDQFSDGDPYDDSRYRSNFRTLLAAQKKRQYVDLDYNSPSGKRVHHYYVPARLEYSVKNDKFRLLALKHMYRNKRTTTKNFDEESLVSDKVKLEILNLSRIQSIRPTDKTLPTQVDLNAIIRKTYYKEPLRLHIINQRNALERAMLHFANYEKNTRKIDQDTYECLIYYNQSMETELLIEVMSFGPMLKVLGNKRFLKSLRTRLQKQRDLMEQMDSFRQYNL